MILQCDQCNTRFRLDDAKLKPGGVKVRCSKCRHVFLAGADLTSEDSEFDAILSGLGAPAPEKRKEAAGHTFDDESGTVHAAPELGVTTAPAFDGGAPQPAEERVSQQELADFAVFDFAAETSVSQEKPTEVHPASGAFDLAPEAPLQQEAQATTVAQGLDYGEFAFDEEPASLSEEPAPAPDETLEFGDFSFAAEPAESLEEPASATVAGLDFGEFDIDAEAPAKQQAPQDALDDLDYGEFSFLTEVAPKIEGPAAQADEASEFGEFSFAEEPDIKGEGPAVQADEVPDFSEFSFAEEPVLAKEAVPVAEDAFNVGEFSFPRDLAGEPAAAAPPADAGRPEPMPLPIFTAAETPEPLNGEAALDFGFASTPTPPRVPVNFEEFEEEVLPPLSIASRRKGRSLLTVFIVAVSVLVIVVLSGAGLYLLQSGSTAFDKLGLGFVANWFGMAGTEEGRITIRNPLAAFYQNSAAGEIFVVTGEAVNSFRKPRASIHVRVSLFDKNGAVLLQKTAYCGNRLSKEQLSTLPMAKIESIMSNQFGDSLANLGVQPGSSIGFVVAIANVPKEAADFGVEVVGSTVAGK